MTFGASCSVPNLEDAQCTQARDAVKKFYSFHFGNDMHPSAENLKARESYLSPSLFSSLSGKGEQRLDYFTASENYPKAFRIGSCRADGSDRSVLQVILLWHSDTASEQKEVLATTVKSGDKWLIDKVSN